MLKARLSICLFVTLGFALSATASLAEEAPSHSQPAPPAAADTLSVENNVVEGPLFEDRKNLYAAIQQAGKKGVGVSGYMAAFKAMEASIKEGQPSDEEIQKQIDRINTELKSQAKSVEQQKTSQSSYEAGRAFGRIVGTELRRKYGGIPPEAILTQEFKAPQFKARITQAFISNLQTRHNLTPAELTQAKADFGKMWEVQYPIMIKELSQLRRTNPQLASPK